MFNIIGRKSIFLSISGLLVLASIVAIAVYGFKPGIDFVGGTLWEIKPITQVSRAEVQDVFVKELAVSDALITETSEAGFLIRLPETSEANHVAYLSKFTEKLGEVTELRFETIGAAVGGELRQKAITAFIFVLVGISLYIAFAFRKVSRPVNSWKYGTVTLITLFHDALIPVGLFAVLGNFYGIEVDTNFIVAILVVMGFSVHDTIVVFDRIRERLRLAGGAPKDFEGLVNESVNQTMARSINTSLTLVLVLLALYFFGSENLSYFVLTILVGTIVGTYSSIFVASPLIVLWRKRN